MLNLVAQVVIISAGLNLYHIQDNKKGNIQFWEEQSITVAASYRVIKSFCAPDDYSKKTRTNILKSFNHLPW
jgi:hypothetical protein